MSRPPTPAFNKAASYAPDSDEVSSFHRLAAQGSKVALQEAIDKYGPAIIDARDAEGRNAFMKAAETCHTPTMEVLLNAGTGINATDKKGNTALLLTAEKGYKAAIEWLLNRGANIDHANDSGQTALMLAGKHDNNRDGQHRISNRKKDAVTALLKRGADMDLKDKRGQTAQDQAEAANHRDVARLIAEDRSRRALEKQQEAERLRDVIHSLTTSGIARGVSRKTVKFKPFGS